MGEIIDDDAMTLDMFQKWCSGTGTSSDLSKSSTGGRSGCAWPAIKPIRALFPNPTGWLGGGLEIVHTLPTRSQQLRL